MKIYNTYFNSNLYQNNIFNTTDINKQEKIFNTQQNFEKKMLEKQKNNNQPIKINPHLLAQALNLAIEAKNYPTWSLSRKKILDQAVNKAFNGYGFDKEKLHKNKMEWIKLGSLIWGLGGITNINVTGFSSLIASIVKQSLSVTMPFARTYADICIDIVMSSLSKYGYPNIDKSIKNAPSYKINNQKYKTLYKQLKYDIKLNQLTKEKLHDYKYELQKIKLDNNKQNDNMQYALVGSLRSVVRIIITAILVGLVIGTGGISIPFNILIISISQFIYMLACGFDTSNQNKHIMKCNTKRMCFVKQDFNIVDTNIKITHKNIDIEKSASLYSNKQQIEKLQIRSIYSYELSKIQKQIDKFPFGYHDKEEYIYLQSQKMELMHQIDIYEEKILSWDRLNPNMCIGKCLNSKKTLIKKAVKSGWRTDSAISGQAIKNYAADSAAIVLNAAAEETRYCVEGNANAKNTAFSILKLLAGVASPLQRPFCSMERQNIKDNLTHKSDIIRLYDKNLFPVTRSVKTPHGVEIDLFSSAVQSHRIKTINKRLKRNIKGLVISTLSIIYTPLSMSMAKINYMKINRLLRVL